MRIIGGTFKGRKLIAPAGLKTRPTAGKVREALFNILREKVHGARILDLFAGTGAFGLEAISRGAALGVFVDSNRKAVETIKKNISACGADQQAIVMNWNIVRNLDCLNRVGELFDLVFLDPPYNQNIVQPAINNLVNTRMLASDAILVVEHSPDEELPGDLPCIEITDNRRYGKTWITLVKYMNPEIPTK